MAPTKRSAFTLVEMLVVIVIISMLVALLVPAVIGARERARRASCMNNMSQVGKAIIQYETAKGNLPGYVNKIGTEKFAGSVASSNNLSWAVMILENIGRADLWKEWRKKPPITVTRENSPDYTVVVPELLCASDTEKRGKVGALSFAVNCGISDTAADVTEYVGVSLKAYEQSAWGLFFDHDATNGFPGGATTEVKIGLDGIEDGASQTIMLSENLNAGRWASSIIDATSGTPVQQADVGIVWWSTVSGFPWVGDVPVQVSVNSPTTDPHYRPRPSSSHSGGVNAVFADGHSDFISDRVDYEVFRDQMISNQAAAKKHGLIP